MWKFNFCWYCKTEDKDGIEIPLLLVSFMRDYDSPYLGVIIVEIYAQDQLAVILEDSATYEIESEHRDKLTAVELPMTSREHPTKIVDGPAAVIYAEMFIHAGETTEDETELELSGTSGHREIAKA